MKKILILVLLLAPFISGCCQSFKGPQNSYNIKSQDPNQALSGVSLVVGDQIKPGTISIKVNEQVPNFEGQENFITLVVDMPEESRRYTSDMSYVVGDSIDDWQKDYHIPVKNGETVVIPEEIPDNSVISVGTTPVMAHGLYVQPQENRLVDVEITSTGSLPYDESWKSENNDVSKEVEGDIAIVEDQEIEYDYESLEYLVGTDVKEGYVSIECLESSKGYCSISSGAETAQRFPNKELGQNGINYVGLNYDKNERNIPVGESVTSVVPITNGMKLSISPYRQILTVEDVLETPEFETQKIKITIKPKAN